VSQHERCAAAPALEAIELFNHHSVRISEGKANHRAISAEPALVYYAFRFQSWLLYSATAEHFGMPD